MCAHDGLKINSFYCCCRLYISHFYTFFPWFSLVVVVHLHFCYGLFPMIWYCLTSIPLLPQHDMIFSLTRLSCALQEKITHFCSRFLLEYVCWMLVSVYVLRANKRLAVIAHLWKDRTANEKNTFGWVALLMWTKRSNTIQRYLRNQFATCIWIINDPRVSIAALAAIANRDDDNKNNNKW